MQPSAYQRIAGLVGPFSVLLISLLTAPRIASAQPAPASSRFEAVASVGALGVGQSEDADTLGSVELRFPSFWRALRPWVGSSVVDNGTWFAGAGLVYDFRPTRDWTVSVGSGPFYYQSHDRNLGLDLEFHSFVEATHRFRNDLRAGVRLAHLSNGGIGRRNPGTEYLTLVFVVPLHARTLADVWSRDG